MANKPKSILPDAVNEKEVILIKSCGELRPTYEIRLATFMANQMHKRLRIIFPQGASAHKSLLDYSRQHGISIESQP